MLDKLPQRDPGGAYLRKVRAARRIGTDNKCACGEDRPEALIPGSKPICCYECQRRKDGKRTMDNHHFAGESNNPTTVPVPVNDHRAELSAAQYDWPKSTLENKNGSPLLAAAGSIRGFVDYVIYLIKKGLLWAADLLEALDAYLIEKLGPKWWIGTALEQFAPRR